MTSAATAPHMEHMWKGLPEEILVSNVLSRLPMASLCRFRVVCKKWNALPRQSDFATQHGLLASPTEDVLLLSAKKFLLITLKSMQPVAKSFRTWSLVDVINDRVFPLSILLATPEKCCTRILAGDGGLLLVHGYDNTDNQSLTVYNPILKAAKVIPLPLDKCFIHDPLVMFTDTVSLEYKIFVIHPATFQYQTKYMDIYESKTSSWKRVVNVTHPSPSWEGFAPRFEVVKFKNDMYQLFFGRTKNEDEDVFVYEIVDLKPYLIKYDKTTGVGSILDFPDLFPGNRNYGSAHIFQLVVSLGRLFLVYRPNRREDPNWEHSKDCMEVFEFFPEQHKWESLVRMPRAMLAWIQNDDYNFKFYTDWEEGLIPSRLAISSDPVEAIGCASSILFYPRQADRLVTYDLASKSWHQFLYDDRLAALQMKSTRGYLAPQCTNFGLSMCPP